MRGMVDQVFQVQPLPTLLGLRASRWPRAVISSRGRSKWAPSKPVRFVTSFNDRLYQVSGKRCVETFQHYNPRYEVVAYVEARTPEALQAMQQQLDERGIANVNLDELPLLSEFFEVARDVIPQEWGGLAPEDFFPPPTASNPGGYFRKNMYRWFRKIVALDHAMRDFDGVLFWMDCDCYCKGPIPRAVLRRAFGGAGIVYMKANRSATETSLIGFDLAQPGVRELIDGMREHYMKRRFLSLANWDDCVTFDHLRGQLEEPVCRDIGIWADRDGHIMRSTVLAPYLEHDKKIHLGKKDLFC
jgi:hypothetical protein